jgi:hypothetical protein
MSKILLSIKHIENNFIFYISNYLVYNYFFVETKSEEHVKSHELIFNSIGTKCLDFDLEHM